MSMPPDAAKPARSQSMKGRILLAVVVAALLIWAAIMAADWGRTRRSPSGMATPQPPSSGDAVMPSRDRPAQEAQ